MGECGMRSQNRTRSVITLSVGSGKPCPELLQRKTCPYLSCSAVRKQKEAKMEQLRLKMEMEARHIAHEREIARLAKQESEAYKREHALAEQNHRARTTPTPAPNAARSRAASAGSSQAGADEIPSAKKTAAFMHSHLLVAGGLAVVVLVIVSGVSMVVVPEEDDDDAGDYSEETTPII